MATLNKKARDIMVKYPINSCTDVTGFALLGHSFEMAQGSNCTLHIQTEKVLYHKEAWEYCTIKKLGILPIWDLFQPVHIAIANTHKKAY